MHATSESIQRAKEFLVAAVDDHIQRKSKAATNFIIVQDAGVTECKGAACHSTIGYPSPSKGHVLCVGTEIGIRRRLDQFPQEHDVYEPMFQWLIHDPLWAPYLLDRDEAFERAYGVVIDSSAPQNVLQALMITSRMFIEASVDSFELFNQLVADGVPPRSAFVLSFQTSLSSRDYTIVDTKPTQDRSLCKMNAAIEERTGHRPWGLLDFGGLHQLEKGTFLPSAEYRSNWRTNGVRGMFGDGYLIRELMQNETFKRLLSKHRKGDATEAYTPPNPFAPKTTSALMQGQMTHTEFLEVAIPYVTSQIVKKEIALVA